MNRKALIVAISAIALLCCNNPQTDKAKQQQTEQDCAAAQTVGRLSIELQGYPYAEIDSINICIEHGGKQNCYKQKVDERINDSARLARNIMFQQQFNTKDTLTIQLKNGTQYKVYGFQYKVQPHNSMGSHEFGCDLYELMVNGERQDGGIVLLIRKGFVPGK